MTAFIFLLPAESGVTDGARAGLVCVHYCVLQAARGACNAALPRVGAATMRAPTARAATRHV